MTVQTTSLGANSAYVVYSASETIANVYAAVIAWIVNHGWTLHDDTAGAQLKVYKALNADGTTYKYMGLGYDATGIYIRVFEDWNATSHTATNETFYYAQAGVRSQYIKGAFGGYLYMYASARYCIIYARANDGSWGAPSHNTWDGIVEFTRDSRDARGYPVWGFINGFGMTGGALSCIHGAWSGSGSSSGTAGTAQASWLSSTGGYRGIAVPRSTAAYTGTNAERWMNVGCSLGLSQINTTTFSFSVIGGTVTQYMGGALGQSGSASQPFCNWISADGNTATQTSVTMNVNTAIAYVTSNTAYSLWRNIPTSNNAIISQPWAFTPWVYDMDGTGWNTVQNVKETRGRMFGVKILQRSLGTFMDTVDIKVDADGFMDLNGTLTQHHVLESGPDSTVRYAIPV